MVKLWACLLVTITLLVSHEETAYPGSPDKGDGCGEPAPGLKKVNAPKTPMVFASKKGEDRQTLSLFYRRAGSVDFDYHRTGRCERHERGTAVLKPCWWLGSETNDTEQGEAYRVQEYVYDNSRGCTMYLRIAEDDWKAATVSDSGCSMACPAPPTEMHLQKK